ncbi:carbon monoxide dehydrogenase subunit G [Dysgonomonadaceae bacterium PH5-43]|nr:carbon monoxide dehydrogenase subunit G [Dysgonomonadaceae bacterium PH5-43]
MNTDFQSEIKTIPHNQERVFEVLSDMSYLENVKDKLPKDKVQDFSFDKDSCSFSVSPAGNIKFTIIEREFPKTIKFKADKAPFDVFMWIQLVESSSEETKMKLTVKADLNPFLKPMLSKPLQEGINKIADVLAAIPYCNI